MRMGKGFTLIELLVALAVSAILLAVAVPSFAEFIRGVRASSDVSSLAAALSLARSEAVKRNRSACIYSDSWGGGWEVRLDDDMTTVVPLRVTSWFEHLTLSRLRPQSQCNSLGQTAARSFSMVAAVGRALNIRLHIALSQTNVTRGVIET